MASAEWTTARERSCAALRRRWPTDRAPVTAAGRLRALGEPFRPSHLLSNLINYRRFQKNVTPAEPADARPLRNPHSTIWFLPPTPPLGGLWHGSPPVRHMRATAP
jgi:hypothetical protein